jgi:hypothetical protein
VKFNPANGRWEDEVGGNWSSRVNFTLPDNDVIVIDADAATPSILRTVSGVGTTLFDVEVNPANGELWVANTDARNLVRFEPNLRGHLVQTRRHARQRRHRHRVGQLDLNTHINYAVSPGPAGEIAASLAIPGDGVFTASGSLFYLTAFGSGKVGGAERRRRRDRAHRRRRRPERRRARRVGGAALRHEPPRRHDLGRRHGHEHAALHRRRRGCGTLRSEPGRHQGGRKFLYDAAFTSGHGDVACATCHTFANLDGIAWDLGEPQGNFVPYDQAPWVTFAPLGPSTNGFDPMKGPMTTQTLRGLAGLEPFHWRGDRQNFQAFSVGFTASSAAAPRRRRPRWTPSPTSS